MFRGGTVTLKDHLRESLLFNQRLLVAAALGGALLIALVVRMGYLEIISHAHYTTLSEKNRVSILPIPPTRGLVYDRNGVVLAQNLPSYSLELVPERVQDMAATLRSLRELLAISDEDVERFERRLKNKRRFEGVPLRVRLSDEEVARLAVHRHRLPGVDLQARLVRHYPLGALASHAVGYVGRINEQELGQLDPSDYSGTLHIGKVGVERYYEDLLHGTVGYRTVETNAEGRIVHELEGTRTLPVPGNSLFLNLDVRLQQAAEAAFGEENGALVAIDPNNGAVLAMVSVPGYDPNLFVNGIDTRSYRALSHSSERPLFNRALQGQYPPGSTLKPFIGLAGLELGTVGPAESLTCHGWYTLKNDERRYRDWKKEGHGLTDLDRAIVESCDVYFYDLSLALGIDKLHEYLT
ncbi:MAG: penicillin-binding protein 2, partial [Pseudomonadota bacterium]